MVVSLFAFTWLRAKWTYFVLWWYHYSRLHDCERSELTSFYGSITMRLHDCERSELTSFYGSITIRVYMTASEVNSLRSMVVSLFAFTWLRAKWTYFVLWWYHYSRLHDCERSELTSFYGGITIRVHMTASEVNLLRSMVVSLFAFTWLRAKWTYFVLWWYHYSRLHDCERSELTSFYGSITIRVYMTASEVNLLRSMVVSLFAFTWLRAKWTYFVLWWYHYSRLHDCERSELTSFYGGITIRVNMTANEVNLIRSMVVSLFAFTWLRAKWPYFVLWWYHYSRLHDCERSMVVSLFAFTWLRAKWTYFVLW